MLQVLKYGYFDARELAKNNQKNFIYIYFDILVSFLKYKMWSNQYKKEKFCLLETEERKQIGEKYLESGRARDTLLKKLTDERKFVVKYSARKYDLVGWRRDKKIKKFSERYKCGKGLYIGYNFDVRCQHFQDGELRIGENVSISNNVYLDYTGGLTIEDGVEIMEGVHIYTHRHIEREGVSDVIKAPVSIGKGARIMSGAFIGPKVVIGENAVIYPRAVVLRNVKPEETVLGNPAENAIEYFGRKRKERKNRED